MSINPMKILFFLFLFITFISSQESTIIDYKKCTSDSDCKVDTSSCCDTYENASGGAPIVGGKICHRKIESGSEVEVPLGEQTGKHI